MSPDLHHLSGAYAVDALDDAERTSFEQHLAVCADCRAEVAELSATSHSLASLAEATPPPSKSRYSFVPPLQTTATVRNPLPVASRSARSRSRPSSRALPTTSPTPTTCVSRVPRSTMVASELRLRSAWTAATSWRRSPLRTGTAAASSQFCGEAGAAAAASGSAGGSWPISR
jgi:anti-sigma factor RsiW